MGTPHQFNTSAPSHCTHLSAFGCTYVGSRMYISSAKGIATYMPTRIRSTSVQLYIHRVAGGRRSGCGWPCSLHTQCPYMYVRRRHLCVTWSRLGGSACVNMVDVASSQTAARMERSGLEKMKEDLSYASTSYCSDLMPGECHPINRNQSMNSQFVVSHPPNTNQQTIDV